MYFCESVLALVILFYCQVRDGDVQESPLLSRLCGFDTPRESIISSYNKLWIKFETDGSVQTRGFKAVYDAIEIGKDNFLL